jgi:hypothetical protein
MFWPMMRAPLTIAVLWLGCSPAQQPTDPPVHSSPSDAASAQVTPLAEPNVAGLLAVDVPGIVGLLRRNHPRDATGPSEYCLDDGVHYAGAPARVGDVNVFATAFESHVGKHVLLRGRRESSLLAALTEIGPCPEPSGEEHAQMRSDWVSPEGGFRTTRDKLRKLEYFKDVTILLLDLGAVISSDDATTVIELRNPFAAPLDGLSARAHYEGGPGKPMPYFNPVALRIPPGGRQRVELPTSVERGPAGAASGDPRGVYWLHSIDLEGRLGALEVEVSVGSLPRRARK